MVWGQVPLMFVLLLVGTVCAMPSVDKREITQQDNHHERESLHPAQSFSDILPRSPFTDNFEDSQFASSDGHGFVVGKPADFPDFESLGGFGPLGEVDTKESNFVPRFSIPSVGFPDINENQPRIGPDNFPSTKEEKRTSRSTTDAQKKELKSSPKTQEHQESRRHVREARNEDLPDSEKPHSRVTRQFPSFPFFEFPIEPRQRQESFNSPRLRDLFAIHEPAAVPQRRGYNPKDEVRPESQKFYPSFNHNPPKRESHSSQSFFPSGPHPGPRGGGPGSFSSRRPTFRAAHGGRKEAHSPKFAFASNKFKDYGPVDNSILGSGNFEVIKGGTFYDENNPHRNHNPYDPYLDNSYVVFPSSNPHNHNHVDDFFSNFRDFSEFATRRSGTVLAGPNDRNLEPGFASEQVAQISRFGIEDMMTSESNLNPNTTELTQKKPRFLVLPKLSKKEARASGIDNSKMIILISTNKRNNKPTKTTKNKKYISKLKKSKQSKSSSKTRRPNNIQEVLEEIDPFPSSSHLPKVSGDDEDPLIATY